MNSTLFCGTYDNNGIYRMDIENGLLGTPELFCKLDSPKYMAFLDSSIIALCKMDNGAGAAVIDSNGTVTDRLKFEETESCHIACYDDMIYTANYHDGTFSLLQYSGEKLKFIRKNVIRKKAGCHQIIMKDDTILGTALFDDCIYLFDRSLDIKGRISFPENTGPRHGVLSEDGKYLYVVTELSNEVYSIKTDSWEITGSVKLTDRIPAASAAIRLYQGKLFVSVRDCDLVCSLTAENGRLGPVRQFSCGRSHPRDMLVADGSIICANRLSDSVDMVSETGTACRVTVPQAVCLLTR